MTSLAIAESADAKREAYMKAADEVIAEFESGTSYARINRALGRGNAYANRLADWRRSAGATNGDDLPFSAAGPGLFGVPRRLRGLL